MFLIRKVGGKNVDCGFRVAKKAGTSIAELSLRQPTIKEKVVAASAIILAKANRTT